MNETAFPSRQELKLRAKGMMSRAFFPCCALGVLMVLGVLVSSWFLQNSGGAISLYYWDAAGSDIPTSFLLSEEGLFAALRLEEYGLGLSVAVTPTVLYTFLLVRLIAAAVLAPLQLGCLDCLWAIRQGAPKRMLDVFQWYIDLKKAARAILLQAFLWLEQAVLTVVFSLPALAVLYFLPATEVSFSTALWLLLLGQAAVWCVMIQFEPVRFQLARTPDAGVGSALRYGRALLTRRHGAYLKFRLSFLIWELMNAFSQGLFQFYLFPYLNLAAMEFTVETEQQIKASSHT